MQALCPQCSQRILIDDAKVPDRPFSVKCPKCQAVVKLAGKGAGAEAAGAPTVPEPAPSHSPSPTSAPPLTEEARAHMMAQIRHEMGAGEGHGAVRALLGFPDPALAGAAAPVLARLGFTAEGADEHEAAARLLEQGAFSLVLTTRSQAPPGKGETVYQRVTRLNPDGRRRIFVILLGDEFKSGDGTQAFAFSADLVLNSRDLPAAENLIRNSLLERMRLYQAFNDARKRFELRPS